MNNQRRHRRFRLDSLDINGKMSLADKVEIIDIGLGGVALKADRRLNIGKEYMIRLGDKTHSIEVKGTVVRSTLSGIEPGADGESVSIYTAGMMFNDGSAGKIAGFLNSIAQSRKQDAAVKEDRRLNVRFHLTTPQEKVLDFPAQFKVHEISLSGMRILTDHSLALESMVPMWLSLNAEDAINFKGRVASCRKLEENGPAPYEIGVAFSDLKHEDRQLLAAFIDYLTALEVTGRGRPVSS